MTSGVLEGEARVRLQAGGLVSAGALYVPRAADRVVFESLHGGGSVHLLAARQVGKSSLTSRLCSRLRADRDAVRVDLTGLGTATATGEQWCYSLCHQVARALKLPGPAGVLHPGGPFAALRDWMLQTIEARPRPMVLLLDEVDSTLTPGFPRDAFFGVLRSLVEEARALDGARGLCVCLSGTLLPEELIEAPSHTPFNLSKAARLEDFDASELRRFAPALSVDALEGTALADAIFQWTHGHPYLSQRIAAMVLEGGEGRDPQTRVQNAVEILLQNRRDEPNFVWVDYLLRTGRIRAPADQLLNLLDRVRRGDVRRSADPVHAALLLTGVVCEELLPGGGTQLRFRNRVLAQLFDDEWAAEARYQFRPLAAFVAGWRPGAALPCSLDDAAEAVAWASGRSDLTAAEALFVQAVQTEREQSDEKSAERRVNRGLTTAAAVAEMEAQELRMVALVLGFVAVVAVLGWMASKVTEQL